MANTLHLLLLHLAVALTDGGNGYLVYQPRQVYGVEGGSVTLPCSFSYPDNLRPRDINVFWRFGQFHGQFIFNCLQAFTDSRYKGRITLLGSPIRDHTASIRLDKLRRSDSGSYFCRVQILGDGNAVWQSVTGTLLSVGAPTVRPSVTVTVKSTTSTVRPRVQVTVERTTSTEGPSVTPAWLPFVAGGCGLVLLLLLIAGVVICICQRKRRRKDAAGVRDNHSPKVPVSKANGSEEIVYSVLTVKKGSGPRNVSQPEPDLLYAAVRFSPNQS